MVLVVKNLLANAGDIRDIGLIPGLGRSPGEGHDNPVQYFCLKNPMDRGAWRVVVHRVTKSWTQLKWLSMHAHWVSTRYQLERASLMAQMVKNPPAVQETWVRSLGQEDPLEKDVAPHSSILAWRIPWTEEPSGLQSMGWQRVRHDWVTNTATQCPKNVSF